MTKATEIKLVVTDMDGTLLGSDKKISLKNIKTISTLNAKNIPLVLCTGRPHFMVDEYIRQLNLTTPLISSNGALIQELQNEKIIFKRYFSVQTIKRITDFCLAEHLDFLMYDEANVYFVEFSQRIQLFDIYNKIAQEGGSPKIPLKNMQENYNAIISGDLNITKVLISKHKEDDLKKSWNFLDSMNDIYAVPSMDTVIDIMPTGISKGEALKKVAEYLSIPLSHILVIGDHKNDVSMLSIAGFSACLANGEKEALQTAQYITTKNNDEAGFSEAVAHFISLGGENEN